MSIIRVERDKRARTKMTLTDGAESGRSFLRVMRAGSAFRGFTTRQFLSRKK